MGVYASALIKKRRYWPKHIKGQEINDYFEMEEVGATKRLPGMLDGVKFDVFAMKEPEYVMMLMSTYGCLSVKSGQKVSVRDNDGDIKFLNTQKRLRIISTIVGRWILITARGTMEELSTGLVLRRLGGLQTGKFVSSPSSLQSLK